MLCVGNIPLIIVRVFNLPVHCISENIFSVEVRVFTTAVHVASYHRLTNRVIVGVDRWNGILCKQTNKTNKQTSK